MAGQPAEHPSERPKSNRFSVSLFASVVLGAANDVLKLVTSLACFIFRFLRRPLRGPGGPFWPLLGAIEGRRCLVGLVDRLGTKRRLVTVEGRFLTLGGQRTPARC